MARLLFFSVQFQPQSGRGLLVESGSWVDPGSSTASGFSPLAMPGCSSSCWKETWNKTGKWARSISWASQAESHGLCLAGSVGRLENLLQPAHPQMTSVSVFSFSLCHSDWPFGSCRVLVPRSCQWLSRPGTGLEDHGLQTAKRSDPIFPQAFPAESQEYLFTFSGEKVDQCDCLL